MAKFEYSSAVTGMGMSDIGRRLMRDPMALTVDASLAAIADAGLTRDDIDGVCTYPGMVPGACGFSGAATRSASSMRSTGASGAAMPGAWIGRQ